jgi:hypothetical protein
VLEVQLIFLCYWGWGGGLKTEKHILETILGVIKDSMDNVREGLAKQKKERENRVRAGSSLHLIPPLG